MSESIIKKPCLFRGAASALVTPFRNGKIDFEAFGRLIEWQIAGKIDALVVCGTTGESATLSDDEHLSLITFAVEKTAGRVPVIAGTGSNDTAHAVFMSKEACARGADGLLVVTPYYNKTTPAGLCESFLKIADASTKPILLYNVPSRTGMTIPLSAYRVLAEHEKIVGTKEASGDIGLIAELIAELGGKLAVYSGNDDLTLPILSLGGAGVISVVSNLLPETVSRLCRLTREGEYLSAAEIQLSLVDLIRALFLEPNPIPVKAALTMMGKIDGEIRLPLTALGESHRKTLTEALIHHGLLPPEKIPSSDLA